MSRPSGVVAGDVLLAVIDARLSSTPRITAPPGWMLVRRDSGEGGANLTQAVYYRVAGSSEPSAFTWKLSTSAAVSGGVASYAGVDPSSPIRDHTGVLTISARPQLIPAPSAWADSEDLVVGLYGTSGSGRVTQPAAMTERFDRVVRSGSSSRTVSSESADAPSATSGPTLDRTAESATQNSRNIGQLVVLAGLPASATELAPASPSPSPDFTFTASPGSFSVPQGGWATTTISVGALDGFSSAVALSAAGLPAGASASFSPGSVSGSGASQLTITASGSTPAGTYPVTVDGVSGSLSHVTTVSLTVTSVAPSGTVGTALPPLLPSSTGTTFYVATSGADTNPGTAAAPWRTVQKALGTLQPGQVALVREGIYTQSLMATRAGTGSAPITIQAYPGERPVIRPGTGATNNVPLQIGTGAANLRFRGLVFEGATGPSTTNIYAWGSANHVEISDCEVRGSARQGFFSERSTSSIHIVRCNFHGNGGYGPSQQDHNIYIEGSGHLIASSIVRGARNGFGIQIYPASSNIVVADNTIVDNKMSGIVIGSDGSTTASGARITGNITAFNGQFGITTYWGGSIGSDNRAWKNLAFGNAAGAFSGSGITYQSNILSDPRFVDRTAGDLRLLDGSPAIDAAQADFATPTDILGVVRPLGAGPDLGAFER